MSQMGEEQIKNIVAFCILMESGSGILGKSPDYVREKYRRYCASGQSNAYNFGLDENNKEKLDAWIERWLK